MPKKTQGSTLKKKALPRQVKKPKASLLVKRKKSKHKTRILLVYFFIVGLALSALAAFLALSVSLRDIPSVHGLKEYKSSFTTRLYSRNGILLNNYSIQNRVFISIDDVPAIIKQAFISAEDSGFYSHSGIDLTGILSAAYKNILFFLKGEGQLIGASTITQQVVKNILLNKEKTIARKIKEIVLSLEASRVFTKDEILEIYLNHIFLGSGAYGVVAAAHEYFGKPLKDLNIQEAALLAALPKAPSEINPRRNMERALERRNWVMQKMAENGYLTPDAYSLLKASPIEVVKPGKTEKASYGVNSFSDYIKSMISSSFGSRAFLSGGYYIQTTLDYNLQKILYEAFREGMQNYDKKTGYRPIATVLKLNDKICASITDFIEKAEIADAVLKYGAVTKVAFEGLTVMTEKCEEIFLPSESYGWAHRSSPSEKTPINLKRGQIVVYEPKETGYALSQMPEANGGAIIMDPKSGEVLAMIGDFYDRPNSFNRAIFAKRQLGSAVKPFVYITALENGFTPASTLVDEDLKLSDEWQPRNASKDFLGIITLRTALERSRNIPTVRLAEMLGSAKFIKRFKEFGLNVEPIDNDLTTVLGSFNVTVERVAKAFSVFVNNGKKPESVYILKIQDSEGKNLFSKDGMCGKKCSDIKNPPVIEVLNYGEKIAEKDVSFQILSMLEGSANRGTARAIRKISTFGIGGKTGSTNDHKDAWFAGVTNSLAIAIYVGNDKPKTLGHNQYGAAVALPIFTQVIKNSASLYPVTPFEVPEDIEQIKVEYDTGEIAGEKPRNAILENFKKNDKKPRKSLVNFVEEGKEIEEKSLHDQLDKGIY